MIPIFDAMATAVAGVLDGFVGVTLVVILVLGVITVVMLVITVGTYSPL